MPSITVTLSTSLDAVLRHTVTSKGRSIESIRIGNIDLDPARRLVRKYTLPVRLTPTEFDLLYYLMLHAGIPMAHASLEYGREYDHLRTYVRQLRRRLEDNPANPKYLRSEDRTASAKVNPKSRVTSHRVDGLRLVWFNPGRLPGFQKGDGKKCFNGRGPIRILSVDDHPLLRHGIAKTINAKSDMVLVAEASSGEQGIQKFREHQPDVTLMELRLPDMSGIDSLIAIRNEFTEARIIILTTFEGDVEIQRALKAGAYGYMHKSMPPGDLVEMIRQVHSGKKRVPAKVAVRLAEHFGDEAVTGREVDVLQQVAGGNRNREIGQRLLISEETVKVHIRNIMGKLGAIDRTHAVAIAVRRGIIQW